MKFDELPLNKDILAGIKDMGYESLTPIQELTFGPVTDGKDVLGLAQTGSGKTSACAIPILNQIDSSKPVVQALIMVPTRELALQYTEEIDQIGKHSSIRALPVYGGVSMADQQGEIRRGVHVIVATPGRLIDHIYSTDLSFRDIKTFVLDEADEMLNLGFFEDIEFILSCLRHEHQTLLFSATMPTDIDKLCKEHLKDPVEVRLTEEAATPKSIQYSFLKVNRRERFQRLTEYFDNHEIGQCIVFCNSRTSVEDLHQKLKSKGLKVDYIHGGLDQNRRSIIFDKFKRNRVQVMVATDVAGRGLDFSHVTHIVNYDFPRDAESFTHRTGRTGRMGKTGETLTFVSNRDEKLLKEIQEQTGIESIWYKRPSSKKPQRPQEKENREQGNRNRRNTKKGSSVKEEPTQKEKQTEKEHSSKPRKKRKPRRNDDRNFESRNQGQNTEPQGNSKRKSKSRHAKRKKDNQEISPAPPQKGLFKKIKSKAGRIWDKLFW